MTAEACLKRWRNLRDQFVRELKRRKKVKSGDQGPQYISRWPFFEVMKFVSDTVRHREYVNRKCINITTLMIFCCLFQNIVKF